MTHSFPTRRSSDLVVAVLLHEAIGAQLTCVFVDTELLRAGEADEVVNLFREHYNIPLVHADAGALFLDKLAGVSDPEQKSKTIGATILDRFEPEGKKRGRTDFPPRATHNPPLHDT